LDKDRVTIGQGTKKDYTRAGHRYTDKTGQRLERDMTKIRLRHDKWSKRTGKCQDKTKKR
jgi:hypothetical protein